MTEQKCQSSAVAPGETGTMELGEAFKFIGKLARQAAQGDEAARLGLGILEKLQLAEIQKLELELQSLNTRKTARAALSFMRLPEKTV